MDELLKPLFDGERISLGPIDHEKDPEIESRWTHDAEYMRMLSTDAIRPLSPAQVKKKYEGYEKSEEEDKNFFYFTIRLKTEESRELGRLIGFTSLYWIEWSNGIGLVQIGIGDPDERGKGYGTEALGMVLRHAFSELNLFRLSAVIPEYNQVALRLFEKAGFVVEAHRRQALHRDGRRWDLIHMGLLSDEWEERVKDHVSGVR